MPPFRKCKECNTEFEKQRPLQFLCSPECAYKYAAKKVQKKAKKEIDSKVKAMKVNLETKGQFIKILQILFNKFIRMRDENLPCISCGKYDVLEWHAGHFIATTYQYHRFNEDNVHKQCSYCNTHLSGNLIKYRENLVKKVGLERVVYLEETKHMAFDLTITDLKLLIKKYRSLVK